MILQLPIQVPEIPRIIIQQPAEVKPEPRLYTIQLGDNLTKIAEATDVPVDRLWSANPELTDPDLITPKTQLKIPLETDNLEPRPMPVDVIMKPSSTDGKLERTDKPLSRGFSVSESTYGNTYTPGQCTWGVKNWRPSIPNGWGDASNWLNAARSQGYSTGRTPRAGAVAWTSGHVALVVGIKGSQVTIKEMNYNYHPYSVRTITKPASKYVYIY